MFSYFKIFIHKILDLTLLILLEFSFVNFYFKNNLYKKKLFYYVTEVNTYGDAIFFYYYVKLFKKKNSLIISPEVFPSNHLLNFFFKKNEFIFYNEPFYFFINKIHPIIKRKSEILILKILKFNLNAFSYYRSYKKKDKNLKLIQNNLFLKKYLSIRKYDPKFDTLIFKITNFYKKKFIIEKLPGYSSFEEKKILYNLGLKNSKYVCVYIKPYPKNKIYGYKDNYEANPRCINFYNRYYDAIKYLLSKKLKIIIMGKNNENLKKIFKNSNVIYYNETKYQSVINDFYLVNNCLFYIGCQGGAVSVPTILNKHILFLNNVSFHDIFINKNIFFFPKHFFKNGKEILLQERINSYEYFFNSPKDFNSNYQLKELSKFEILYSVKCMYNFLVKKSKKFFIYNISNLKKYHLSPYYSNPKLINFKDRS